MADNILKASIVLDAPNVEQVSRKVSQQVGNLEKSLSKLPKATDQASFALTNLGRVAQDAPFGFLGIQNNINPLIESFGRLKATAGTTGGAFKALAGSLAGPAGIGFAVSIASSLFLTFGDRLFGASKAAKEMDEATQKLASSLATDLVGLTTVVGLIQNTATATDDRTKALKFLNQEYVDYLKNIGIEEVTIGNLTESYNKLVDSMLRQSVVKGLQESIAKEVEKTAGSIIKLSIEQEQARLKSEAATKSQLTSEQKRQNAIKQSVAQSNSLTRAQSDGYLAQVRTNQVLDAGIARVSDYDYRIQNLKDSLLRTLQPALNLTTKFADLGDVLKPDKTKKGADDVIAQAKRIADYFNDRSIRDIKIDFSPFEKDEAENKAKAREFIKAFERDASAEILKYPFDFNINSRVGIDVSGVDFRERLAKDLPKIQKATEEEIAKRTKTNPILAQFRAVVAFEEGVAEAAKKAAADLTNQIRGAFEGAFVGLGEGLGKVLGGADFGQAIFSVIGDLISQIGKALIQFAIVQGVIQKILANPLTIGPGLALAAGIAAVAVGALIKSTKVRGQRAGGGRVNADGSYLVGERGPELFQPSVTGNIIPNSQLGGRSIGGGGIQVAGEFRISGNDLIAVLARANRSQGRLS